MLVGVHPPPGDHPAIGHRKFTVKSEDGYRLWLRYDPLPARDLGGYQSRITFAGDPRRFRYRRRDPQGVDGRLFRFARKAGDRHERSGPGWRSDRWNPGKFRRHRRFETGQGDLSGLGAEGFLIRTAKIDGHRATVIASASDVGALYGTFHFLRMVQTLQSIKALNISEKPRFQIRMLDHWDNLDGSIERGYAGQSLWDWKALPDTVDRAIDRLCAGRCVHRNQRGIAQ